MGDAPIPGSAGVLSFWDDIRGEYRAVGISASFRNGLPVDVGDGVILAGGNPNNYGRGAAGTNDYQTIVISPNRVCHNLLIHLDAGNDAVVSLDGGNTDQFFVQANQVYLFEGLQILPSSGIQGKNEVTDAAFTNLRISVW